METGSLSSSAVETGSLSSSLEETESPSSLVGGTEESDVPEILVLFSFDLFVGNLGFLDEPEVSEDVVLELGRELVLVVFPLDFLVGSFFVVLLVGFKLFEVVIEVALEVVRVVGFTFGRHLVDPLPPVEPRDEEGLDEEDLDEEGLDEEPRQFLEVFLDAERWALVKLRRRQERIMRAKIGVSLIFSVESDSVPVTLRERCRPPQTYGSAH